MERQFLRAVVAGAAICSAPVTLAQGEERHRIKLPYIPYHKFIEQPWQKELKDKLLTICMH